MSAFEATAIVFELIQAIHLAPQVDWVGFAWAKLAYGAWQRVDAKAKAEYPAEVRRSLTDVLGQVIQPRLLEGEAH